MTEFIIKIDMIYFLGIIGSIVLFVWWSGNKLGGIEVKIENFDSRLTDIDTRLTNIEGKSSGALVTLSPISLSEFGRKILNESGMRELIDKQKETLKQRCFGSNINLLSPYDIQQKIFNFFDEVIFHPTLETKFKTYAFNQGVDYKVLRRVGAIYFRDIVLNDHNIDPNDIDKK